MKIRLLLAGLLIAASATSSMAAGPYIGASAGATMLHDSDVEVSGFSEEAEVSYDAGAAFNVVGGYNFDGVRLEGEFGYKNADVDEFSAAGSSISGSDSGSEISIMSYMVNGYYDIKTTSAVTPFLGVGIGLLNGEFEDDFDTDDDTVFGYQLSAGASFKVSNNVNLDVSYRFQGAASDFKQDGVEISYHSSNLLAGVRYTF